MRVFIGSPLRGSQSCALPLPLHQPAFPASQHLCSRCSQQSSSAWELRTALDLVLLVRSFRLKGLGFLSKEGGGTVWGADREAL